MAGGPESVKVKIEETIEKLTEEASGAYNGNEALRFAMAVNQLAEARAWLSTTAMPHGGSAYSEGSS